MAELLQVLISRGESELSSLPAIESALTVRLFLSVHRGELDLQNKLLHVLHSVIHASASAPPRRGHHQQSPSTTSATHAQAHNDAQPPDLTHDDLFVRAISDAIQQPSNAVIHHWIDFLLMTIPQFRHALHSVILPLVDQLVARLDALVDDFRACYVAASLAAAEAASSSSATDAEFTVITNALERLLLIAVSESVPAPGEDDSRSADRAAGDTGSSGGGSGGGAGGLLGYMTGVLSHQELDTGDIPEQVKVRRAVDLSLAEARLTSYRVPRRRSTRRCSACATPSTCSSRHGTSRRRSTPASTTTAAARRRTLPSACGCGRGGRSSGSTKRSRTMSSRTLSASGAGGVAK